MNKKRGCLTPIQIAVLGFMIIIGVLLFLGAKPYKEQRSLESDSMSFGFLQKGTYTLEVTYENTSAGNGIVVYSDVMADENNAPGTVYTEQAVSAGAGVVLVPLALEQSAYEVNVGLKNADGGFVSAVLIQSNQLIHKDNYFLGALFLLGAAGLFFCFYRSAGVPLALVLMGVIASIPLFSDSILMADDLSFHLSRLEGLYQGLAAGDFPVRVIPQQMEGFGTLNGIMYPQLFLYPAALLRFFGVSLMLCYKLLIFAINVATAFAGYYAAKNVCRSAQAAMWMSFFYTFSAYRLTNVYMRAALGEALAMIFLPLIIWGVYEVLWGERRWIVLTLGVTGLLGSHLLSLQMCALFMVIELVYWLFSRKKNRFGARFLDGVKAVMATILLNAGFLIPFLYFCGEDLQCFHMPFEVHEHVVYFSQMFSMFPEMTGTSLSPGTTQGEMPLTIGGALLVGVVLFLAAFRKPGRRKDWEGIGIHCLIYGGMSLILASWLFPWEKIADMPVLGDICGNLQFAWRFLGMASVFLCMVSAVGVARLIEEKSAGYQWLCLAMAVLIAVTAAYQIDGLAKNRVQVADKMTLEGYDSADGMYLYMDSEKFRAIQLDYQRGEGYIKTVNGTKMEFSGYVKNGTNIYVEVNPLESKKDYLMFPLYCFPGYEITVNGEAVPVLSRDTLVTCEAPTEPAVIEVQYKGFWFFTAADILTLLTACGILGMGIYKKFPRKKGKDLREETA